MTFKKLLRNLNLVAGFVILLILVTVAVLAPVIATHSPTALDVKAKLSPPDAAHWFGTDGFGRDIFSRVVYGARVSMIISVSVAFLSGLLGSVLGLLAGYFPRLERPIMAVMDGMMAIPSMLMAMAIVAALGSGMTNIILALTISDIPRVVRVVRANVLPTKQMDYVESARSMGASHFRILWKYIFPECISPLIVRMTMTMAFTILEEASLTFLGLGLGSNTPSWGIVLSEGRKYLKIAPYYVILPGIVLILAVYGINALGDGLRDQLDPRLSTQ